MLKIQLTFLKSYTNSNFIIIILQIKHLQIMQAILIKQISLVNFSITFK